MTVKVLDKECCTERPGLDAKCSGAMVRGALRTGASNIAPLREKHGE